MRRNAAWTGCRFVYPGVDRAWAPKRTCLTDTDSKRCRSDADFGVANIRFKTRTITRSRKSDQQIGLR